VLTLYDYLPSGNGYKARLMLALRARPYRLVELDILRGESRTPSFLAKNPNGRIPLLELEDGRCLSESDAILFLLAQGSPFWPESLYAQAEVLQWLFFEQYNHEPNIATARYWLAIRGTPLSALETELLAQKQRNGHAALGVMERRLATHDWLVGEGCSIADIALYAYTHVAGEGGFALDAYPGIRRWLQRIAALPGYIAIDERPRD
jgi:glutathione S-transferase